MFSGPNLPVALNRGPSLKVAQRVQDSHLRQKKSSLMVMAPEMREMMTGEEIMVMRKNVGLEVAAKIEVVVIKIFHGFFFFSSEYFHLHFLYPYQCVYQVRVLKCWSHFVL